MIVDENLDVLSSCNLLRKGRWEAVLTGAAVEEAGVLREAGTGTGFSSSAHRGNMWLTWEKTYLRSMTKGLIMVPRSRNARIT